jgi:hypothetical protein
MHLSAIVVWPDLWSSAIVKVGNASLLENALSAEIGSWRKKLWFGQHQKFLKSVVVWKSTGMHRLMPTSRSCSN